MGCADPLLLITLHSTILNVEKPVLIVEKVFNLDCGGCVKPRVTSFAPMRRMSYNGVTQAAQGETQTPTT